MAKLEEGLFYSASGVGDSVLFRVTNNAIEVVQRHSSLGPITDFCVFDLDKQGRVCRTIVIVTLYILTRSPPSTFSR